MTTTKTKITDTHIEYIKDGFTDHSLPAKEWTHEAHLVTGLALVCEKGLSEAEAAMPDMIKSFNEAKGGINSDTEGYHHTITIFYLRALDTFRRRHSKMNRTQLTKAMLASSLAEKSYPLRYYSKAFLFSKKARLSYVSPDLLEN